MVNFKKRISAFLLTCFVAIGATSFPIFAASKNITQTKPVQVKLNDTAIIPLKPTISSNKIHLDAVIPGPVGEVDITPTSSEVSWCITPSVPADAFIGTLSITDITSGLSAGFTAVYSFDGSLRYNGLSGHRYRATLIGTAYNGSEPVGYTDDDDSANWIC